MQVEDIHAASPQLRQALLDALRYLLGQMLTRGVWVTLRRKHQTSFLPFRVSCKRLLLPAYVGSCCVDFVVALRLEVIEDFVVLCWICDASAG